MIISWNPLIVHVRTLDGVALLLGWCEFSLVIVKAQLPGIDGSKPTKSEGIAQGRG